MIAALTFETRAVPYGGRCLRRATFRRRSSLPVSAACVVANGVRETLASLLNARAGVRLLAPVVPEPHAWALIFAGARTYRVRGPLNDAALVLDGPSALNIAVAVFGEPAQAGRALSGIEEEVLARALASLSAALAPVCGPVELLKVERTAEFEGYSTYFELLVDGPLEARIGVALSRDPLPAAHNCLRIDDLLDVELELNAEFACGEIEARDLVLLHAGTQLRTNTKVGAPALLKLAGRIVARGECGALGGHGAFVVGAHPKGGNL